MVFKFINGDEVPPDYGGHHYYNIKDEPIRNTPTDNPYGYDAYCIYKSYDYGNTEQKDISMVYSDRLKMWNREKYEVASKAVFGSDIDIFPTDPQKIQTFLTIYFGKEIKLLGIEKGCNIGNGYPYWIFYYKEE